MIKTLVITILLTVFSVKDIGKTAKINKLKTDAEKAYKNKQFNLASQYYSTLVDTLGVTEENEMLNLANAYFHLKDTTNAINTYLRTAATATKPYTKSVAFQQIGVIDVVNKRYEKALESFKQALRAYPENQEARFNYELVKKLLEQQRKQQQNSNNKDQSQQNQDKDKQQQDKDKQQQDKDKQQQDNKDKKQDEKGDQKDKADKQEKDGKDDKAKKEEGEPNQQEEQKGKEEEKERNQKLSQRLMNMKLTEEKAKEILDAMKNEEVQYLQQNRKRPQKRNDRNKQDW